MTISGGLRLISPSASRLPIGGSATLPLPLWARTATEKITASYLFSSIRASRRAMSKSFAR